MAAYGAPTDTSSGALTQSECAIGSIRRCSMAAAEDARSSHHLRPVRLRSRALLRLAARRRWEALPVRAHTEFAERAGPIRPPIAELMLDLRDRAMVDSLTADFPEVDSRALAPSEADSRAAAGCPQAPVEAVALTAPAEAVEATTRTYLRYKRSGEREMLSG